MGFPPFIPKKSLKEDSLIFCAAGGRMCYILKILYCISALFVKPLEKINYPAASSGVLYVMPDLIRHPVRFLDSGVRRNDGTRGKSRGIYP